jgi:hypothetical protein
MVILGFFQALLKLGHLRRRVLKWLAAQAVGQGQLGGGKDILGHNSYPAFECGLSLGGF